MNNKTPEAARRAEVIKEVNTPGGKGVGVI